MLRVAITIGESLWILQNFHILVASLLNGLLSVYKLINNKTLFNDINLFYILLHWLEAKTGAK